MQLFNDGVVHVQLYVSCAVRFELCVEVYTNLVSSSFVVRNVSKLPVPMETGAPCMHGESMQLSLGF